MALLRRIRALCAGLAVPRARPRMSTLLTDVAITVAVGVVTAIMIHEAVEQGSRPPDAEAYALGVLMVLPVALQRRRPVAAMLASSGLLLAYYAENFPGIAPTPVLAVPLYTAVLSGRLVWSIGVCLPFFVGGYVIVVVEGTPALNAFAEFLPHLALAAVVILLAEVVRSRRALTEETRERLRLAEEDRAKDAARKIAEERVRIARELHDTVAHSMATITVQAASALHVLDDGQAQVRTALVAIRGTSKQALREIGDVLGVLREGDEPEPDRTAGLDRL
ncbi:sensor histidine kinase, partial [Actinomadura sp. HBU206391]|uniref:sensor histidine kinase n=1 Tax=Actinomadura sp. HBU206391 TaxID=2731692 RepID=UPI00164F3A0F